jgi:class 3 adenylate cyclase/predicted metal-dependent HD superfamily phosphohydrolase
MNFLIKFTKVGFIFFSFLGFSQLPVISQITHYNPTSNPHVQFIFPDDLNLSGLYSQVVQDGQDNIFIAAEHGVLKYNGKGWSFTGIPGPVCITLSENKFLYAGGNDLFGSLGTDNRGILSFNPIIDKNSQKEFRPGQVRRIISIGNDIYIISDKGLFLFENGTFTEMQAADYPFLDEPCNHKVQIIKKFSDNYFLSENEQGDLVVRDKNGHLCTRINKDLGIRGTDIRDIYYDGYDNLWILLENYLCRVELFAPLTFFSPPSKTKGIINDLALSGDQLLISSSAGLFTMCTRPGTEGYEDTEIQVLTDHPVSCYDMVPFGTGMLVSSSEGIYQYLPSSGLRLVCAVPSKVITRSSTDTTIVYFGPDSGGVSLLQYAHNEWISLGPTQGLNIPVTGIAETKDRFIWAGTFNSGLFRAAIPEHFGPGEKITFSETDVLPGAAGSTVRLIFLNNTLLASTSSGINQYEPETGTFTTHPVCSVINKTDHLKQPVVAGNSSRAWLSYVDDSNGRTVLVSFDPLSYVPSSLDTIEYRRLDKVQIYSMLEDRQNLWLATSAGLARIAIDYPFPRIQHFFTFIDRVIIDNDSVISCLVPDSLVTGKQRLPVSLSVPHSYNNLRFEFTSTDYNSEGNTLFQYSLDEKGNLWSHWTDNYFVDLSDLPGGRYTFAVKSKDIYGNISTPAYLDFTIRVPYYTAWWAFLIYIILLLILLYFLRKWQHFQKLRVQYRLDEIIHEKTDSLIKEKEKTDSLLANILPQKTADELKSTGKATSSKFKMVTVLFSDIQGFTKIAEQMNPEKLIDELDKFYFQFDTVVEKYNIEKIKTIGDAYMAAGGIPVKNRTNPVEVVLAGLEMQHYMNELKKANTSIWDLRIGIHTGSVIAGVVGQKKFTYDIWGDTVNTASRMESSGSAGKVNISGTCFNLVQQFFDCEYRGKMPVKYKGDIDMYFVIGLKPEFRGGFEYSGNEKLQVQLQLLRLQDLEEVIMQRLETDIPEYLFYHNAAHTAQVYAQVELLGRSEGVNDEEMLLVRTAALLHDIGYIYQYAEHENKSAEIAREILPSYKFSQEHIDKICKLILATSIPHKPEDLLEKIIIDANLNHLGRVDFLILSDRLFQEYRTMKIISSKKDWNEHQVNFLTNHEFYTAAANSLREINRKDQIENIRKFS